MTDEREQRIRDEIARGNTVPTDVVYLLARLDEAREDALPENEREELLAQVREAGRVAGEAEAEAQWETERTALQAQVAQMREAIERLLRLSPDHSPAEEEAATIAFARAALSSSTPSPRWEAAMRVIEAVARWAEARKFKPDMNGVVARIGSENALITIYDAWAALGTDEGVKG